MKCNLEYVHLCFDDGTDNKHLYLTRWAELYGGGHSTPPHICSKPGGFARGCLDADVTNEICGINANAVCNILFLTLGAAKFYALGLLKAPKPQVRCPAACTSLCRALHANNMHLVLGS